MVRRARRVQAELDALDADVAALRDEVTGTVRLGLHRHLRAVAGARSCSRRSTAQHPKVHVIVVDATTTSLVPRLLADELDLAVVNLPVANPELSTEPLFDEDRLLIAPDGPPAGRTRPRRPSPTSPTTSSCSSRAAPPSATSSTARSAAAGIELRAKAEVDGLRLIATLAFQGFGAAIVPATAAPDWLEGSWRRVPVDGLARRSVGLARRSRGLLPAPARGPARGDHPRWWPPKGPAPRACTRADVTAAHRAAGSQPPHDPHRPRRVRPPGVAVRRDHHRRRARGGARAR